MAMVACLKRDSNPPRQNEDCYNINLFKSKSVGKHWSNSLFSFAVPRKHLNQDTDSCFSSIIPKKGSRESGAINILCYVCVNVVLKYVFCIFITACEYCAVHKVATICFFNVSCAKNFFLCNGIRWPLFLYLHQLC